MQLPKQGLLSNLTLDATFRKTHVLDLQTKQGRKAFPQTCATESSRMPDGQNREQDLPSGDEMAVRRNRQRPTADLSLDELQAEARDASEFLKAMGHEGRLMMLYYLCERDHSVAELERLIMSRQAAVSQQLARLRHEKLVTTRREGNQIFYSLADDRVREAVQMVQRLFRINTP